MSLPRANQKHTDAANTPNRLADVLRIGLTISTKKAAAAVEVSARRNLLAAVNMDERALRFSKWY